MNGIETPRLRLVSHDLIANAPGPNRLICHRTNFSYLSIKENSAYFQPSDEYQNLGMLSIFHKICGKETYDRWAPIHSENDDIRISCSENLIDDILYLVYFIDIDVDNNELTYEDISKLIFSSIYSTYKKAINKVGGDINDSILLPARLMEFSSRLMYIEMKKYQRFKKIEMI